MGRELLASMPIFRREIARCADEMKRHAAWDLLEELTRDEASSRLGETEIAQPALFALQVALAAVWRSWGIEPHALVGHSVGEVAAAYLGGVLSFDDAVKVICHRGRLMQRATGLGKMAAIELPEADIEKLLEPYRDRVSTAAINSPTSTVISGEAAAIEEIVSVAKSRGIPSKVLPVNYAFHSPQMEPFGPEMAEAVSGLTAQCGSVPVYSTVTGAQATKADFNAALLGAKHPSDGPFRRGRAGHARCRHQYLRGIESSFCVVQHGSSVCGNIAAKCASSPIAPTRSAGTVRDAQSP